MDSSPDKLLGLWAVSSFILTPFTLFVSRAEVSKSCVFMYIFRDVNIEAMFWALVENKLFFNHNHLPDRKSATE